MKAKPIKYVKHPITAEQKAKLIAEGCKIIDEAYKPAEAEKPKRVTTKQTETDTAE
jgi:hypothetical protein